MALVLIGLTAIGLAVVLSSWITQPIRRLIEYINSIQQGKPSRLPELGSSEIGTLGSALENMRAKLEGKNYIEDYIRALTHEMKSPLTAIRKSLMKQLRLFMLRFLRSK
ncbi:MAG: HAMP domain-containing protein [Bdellovibrionales bacterium]|nr:HAMP domain-containing protein [Bdellovibrionales bacterium]